MKKNSLHLWIFGLTLFLLVSCARKVDPSIQIEQAVAGTLAAIPSATQAPQATPYPQPTPIKLSGLFCEYEFCIGHPSYLNFFDKTALDNPEYPSTYQKGSITALSKDPLILILLIWVHAPGTTDSQFLIDTILSDETDTQTGTFGARLIHDMNVMTSPISSIVSADLTTGLVAGWTCGDRVFAWKIYTHDAATAESIFTESINRFNCNK